MTPATVAALQAEFLEAGRKYHEATDGGPADPLYAGGMLRRTAKAWASAEHQLEVDQRTLAKHTREASPGVTCSDDRCVLNGGTHPHAATYPGAEDGRE